jgi:class 3 adenylate cyclase/alpha-beta hydrolase superfamily lysophospholipase
VIERDQMRYATSGDLRIAYQTFGAGDLELVFVPGFISNLDMVWQTRTFAPVLERLGRFARCVTFDKRGTGLSDRELGFGSLEERMDDIRAVVDAVEFEQPAIVGVSEGGPLSLLFAATYPGRVRSAAIYGTMARVLAAPDYPDGVAREDLEPFITGIEERWGTASALGAFVQHMPDTAENREFVARYSRGACSPRMARQILTRNIEIDVRAVLPAVNVPTLVLHSTNDPLVPVAWGRYIAEHVVDARFIERDADYHMIWDGANAWFLDDVEEFVTGHRPAATTPSARVLATVLFTDIVGSTERAASLGDHEWRRLLDEHDTIAAQRIAAFDGTVVKTTGDGVLATFDGPSRAVACAQAIREELVSLDLQVRAGVHTGELERRGDDVGGIGVHIGSRIAGLAGPGEVWVSRTVKDLTAGSGLEFDARGAHALKGVPEQWELYALTA